MNKFGITTICIVVFCLGFVISKAIEKQNEEIPTITVQRNNIEYTLDIAGYIEPVRIIDIRSSISGTLETLNVTIGDKVETGMPIADIRFVKDPIELRQLKDNIEVSKLKLTTKSTQFERTKQLYEAGHISQEEFEQEETDYGIMLKNHETLEAELAMALGDEHNNQISNTISATNSGTIIDLPVKEGGSVMARGAYSEGTTIARIADLETMEFIGSVAEADIDRIEIGREILISIATCPDSLVQGKINIISPTSTRSNGIVTYEIHALIDSDNSSYKHIYAGCSAIAKIVLAEAKDVWSLTEKNIKYRGDSSFVEVIDKKGKITKKYITTGISDGIWVEIISGVDSTTMIINEAK
ncbi:MAG: efflux RND transporter periplasmic adaptor subunit [Marinilabiliaceae bacterium]|nr:efflux RND transporter periplasmic adaptor subunit [Marinilabiliaceae bacterium]